MEAYINSCTDNYQYSSVSCSTSCCTEVTTPLIIKYSKHIITSQHHLSGQTACWQPRWAKTLFYRKSNKQDISHFFYTKIYKYTTEWRILNHGYVLETICKHKISLQQQQQQQQTLDRQLYFNMVNGLNAGVSVICLAWSSGWG